MNSAEELCEEKYDKELSVANLSAAKGTKELAAADLSAAKSMGALTETELKMLQHFRKLSPKQQQALIQVFEE